MILRLKSLSNTRYQNGAKKEKKKGSGCGELGTSHIGQDSKHNVRSYYRTDCKTESVILGFCINLQHVVYILSEMQEIPSPFFPKGSDSTPKDASAGQKGAMDAQKTFLIWGPDQSNVVSNLVS